MNKKAVIFLIALFTGLVVLYNTCLFSDGEFYIDISKPCDFMLISENKNPDHIEYCVKGEISDTVFPFGGLFFCPNQVNEKFRCDQYDDTLRIQYRPKKEGLKGFLKVKYRF
jgi:hypothetical protein